MNDRETNLAVRWRNERPMYEAWGAFVSETITATVGRAIQPTKIEMFFRLPISCRTKEESSLLAKAFHRGKPYADPYNDIEDKVGVRVVVLFTDDIRLVESAITSCGDWTATKARDFEDERQLKPFEFDYQSLHYIVRANAGLLYNGTDIQAGTPCEIQIRTILQHAYSELTHDTIYKPSVQAEPDVKRAAAKSMALIEATDDYFTQVRERLAQAQAPGQKVSAFLDGLYRDVVSRQPDPSPLNTLIVDHYKKWAIENFEVEIGTFFEGKAYLADFVRERAPTQLLFRQPGILLVYWAIQQAPRGAVLNSPLSDDELAPLYGDLGQRLPDARA